MILWRLTRRPYADLSGRGGELADGRWHRRGRPVVYCAASAALAVLEVRVHLDLPLDLLPDDYILMQIEAPDDLAIRTIGPSDLPAGWRSREDLCRPIGDAWLGARSTALLSVPSAIVEVDRNVLLNPRHPHSTQISVTGITSFG
ncbi:MAG TPA: RES family NAD+ phosphorylase [Geminicoccaceae bacterium]|nr:RES family NAD+ phosphorylase [Geminicoccaceae bacterium]